MKLRKRPADFDSTRLVHRFNRVGSILAAILIGSFGGAESAEKPNILFIYADDLAWSDLGCYGHPWHETPHLERLASEGVRFTDAYAPAPICSASRASVLTGKTPARLHFEFVTKNEPGSQTILPPPALEAPPFTLNLPIEEQTIPESLKEAGYRTAFMGKWHLNAHHGGYLGWSPTHGPAQQGFQVTVDEFGSHPYAWRGKSKPEPITESGRYPEDSLTNRACEFLEKSKDSAEPFFLMFSAYFVHTPVATPCRWLLEKYESRVPVDSPNRNKRIAYGAFVETLDHQVGEVLMALDAGGLGDRTLVVFTSDNGGHPEFTANGPLRGSKWNLYEGGIRVPMIARWPGAIEAGSICREPVAGFDLLPTFVEIAGGKLDTEIDGVSLAGLLKDPELELDRELVWHFPYYHPEKKAYGESIDSIGIDDFAVSKTRPHSAIRRGDDKLLTFHEDDRIELYHLPSDPGEQKNLSAEKPELAKELKGLLNSKLKASGARFPHPAKKP